MIVAASFLPTSSAAAAPCRNIGCTSTELTGGAVAISAVDVTGPTDGLYIASNTTPAEPLLYQWRLRTPCQLDDPNLGGCTGTEVDCPTSPGRLISVYVIQRQRLAQADGLAVDGVSPEAENAPGTGYGPWGTVASACVDVTDLNPPPSPAEVFRYFETLPLPQLTTRQQPPGEALVGLPVIFFTDSPTTQTFTVDIRGFDVLITANAVSYTWRTGDGTTLTTTDPGAPYPDHTISHEYSSGTYTASLTTTWGATYSVDGGVSADVPGTTTTDGAPATFTVRQARSVLTSPYD
ncbi:hypothetical protein IN07_23930 [Modestobacter caceresii]|uniref:PKD domain-containing protein n=1 Tax=Modestobacter caceresii TaxID=1522368 RepID=A0A098Y1L8_9ACTN|nr:hypothetical protein IN07_23930 [Modestobacter caceresii]